MPRTDVRSTDSSNRLRPPSSFPIHDVCPAIPTQKIRPLMPAHLVHHRVRSHFSLTLTTFFLAAANLCGTVSVPAADLPATERRDDIKPRNVVFILTDDHRYDAMGFAGHPFLETPHLDSIAANGVHLKNAFVTTSLCSPSRASILTGLYTHRHRVIDNNRLVPDGTIFFPQYLQQAGYQTAFIGKWHMGGHHDDPRPGFDRWVSFRGQGNYLSPGPKYTINVDGQRVPQKGYITDELTDYAIDWLEG